MMRTVVLAAAFLASAPVSAAGLTYQCAVKNETALFFVGSEIQSTSDLSAANQFPYKELNLSFNKDGEVQISTIGASLNLEGPIHFSDVNENQRVWSSRSPGYCGLIDADCLSNAMFQANSDESYSLLIQTIGTANVGGKRSVGLASLALQYNCEQMS